MIQRTPETIIVKRRDEKTLMVLHTLPEGTFFGKVWLLHGKFPDREKAYRISLIPYAAKVRGYQVYITLENYSGIDSLPDIYDAKQIVKIMAEYFAENEIAPNPNKYNREEEV
ncbi:MAG: hypothetical protein LBQ39_01915 [Tannerellaceae bacterium]|jgi:hypothetical protein|nr:hypothetical protein [Tannerellaceae bacterium]